MQCAQRAGSIAFVHELQRARSLPLGGGQLATGEQGASVPVSGLRFALRVAAKIGQSAELVQYFLPALGVTHRRDDVLRDAEKRETLVIILGRGVRALE